MAVAGALLVVFSGAANAAIVELSMTTKVANVGHTEVMPYLAAGDIATLTVRYDTDTASSGAFGASTIYKNAITYFGFSIERGGATTYSGGVSGAFGQISVYDNSGSSAFDRITFRIFDDQADYPSGTRTDTNVAPDLALMATGDPAYGDLLFHDFRMHFLTTDNTVLTSEALPTLSDLMVLGGASPFGPHNGNTPWSGNYQSENWRKVLGGFGSFGPGAPRDGEEYFYSTSVREYTGGDVSQVPLPASLPLFAAGFAAVAGLRRKARRKQG